MELQIITFKQLEAQGAQSIAAGRLVFEEKQFRLGPAFGKHCYKAALDFCRIVRADSLLIDHESYLGIWLHYQKKASTKGKNRTSSGKRRKRNSGLTASEKDAAVTELFETAIDAHEEPSLTMVLEPEFIQSVQGSLIEVIGPMGQIVMQKTLRTSQEMSPSELIHLLAKSIPDQQDAQIFLMKFFPS